MDFSKVPQDDLQDVLEMTRKIEVFMCNVLHDAELGLSMSAVMNATINCILSQCKTLDEILFYRRILFEFFDTSIRAIRIKDDSI